MSAALSAPKEELTREEKIVLATTRAYKNTYGGESNIRFREAHHETGISAENWEAAKKHLISRKLLTKAGAITNEGRNAISNLEFFNIGMLALGGLVFFGLIGFMLARRSTTVALYQPVMAIPYYTE